MTHFFFFIGSAESEATVVGVVVYRQRYFILYKVSGVGDILLRDGAHVQ